MPTGYSKLTGQNPFKGKRRASFTPEHRRKMSESMRGRVSSNKGKHGYSTTKKGKRYPEITGPNSKKWVGGTWKYWRKQTLIRDGYACQVCQLVDLEILDVDHIKPQKKYPELKFEMSNLITLCPNCHRRKTIRNRDYYLKYE